METIRQRAEAQVAAITAATKTLALDRDYLVRLAEKAKTPELKVYREQQADKITARLVELTDELESATLIVAEEPPDP